MNKFFILMVSLVFFINYNVAAQLPNHHLTQIGNLTYSPIVNDIWGYVDSFGTEYALVGNFNGVSIVSLANPNNPTELFFVNANQSIWRDIKTFGSRAYAVTEGGGGLLIIDLSDLPNSIQHRFHTNQIGSAHNLWIDEQGFLFTVGGSGNGAPVFFEVQSNPDTPVYVGTTIPSYYAHDVFVRGDTMWSSNIYEGFFSVIDVSNKSAPVLLATQLTPRNFTHNAWLSDDGKALFTTDEKAGAWIGSYDVADLGNIQELDRWRTPNVGVVPHNVHVQDDYLVISYYDDGIVILDGSRPSNLVEVARYDSYPLTPGSQFDGAWGAYPFLPSGRILVSDRQTGLHVLDPSYQRACWLEGIVSDSISGAPIFGALISLTGNVPPKYSSILGEYKTGHATAGTYQLTVSKLGYNTKTYTATLLNGQLTIQNVELVPSPTVLLEINVQDNQNLQAIGNAIVEIRGLDTTYIGQTNLSGIFQQQVLLDTYNIWVGHWGHQTQTFFMNISSNSNPLVKLNQGYKDEFELDLGWTVGGSVTKGNWVQENPSILGNVFPFFLIHDSDDLGSNCMTTGAYTPSPIIWMDSGTAIMSSPIMDLSNVQDPYLDFKYHYYIINLFAPNFMEVILTNGMDTVSAFTFDTISNGSIWKQASTIRFSDHLSLTNNMQVHIHAHNNGINSSGKIRAWIDDFVVTDSSGNHIAVLYYNDDHSTIQYGPNPFEKSIQLNYDNISLPSNLGVYNLQGQLIYQKKLVLNKDVIELGHDWQQGLYFIRLGNKTISVQKL